MDPFSYHPVILKLELLSQGLSVSDEAEEEIGKGWKKGGKHLNQRSVFKTAKEMVRSMIGWTVTILATPDRLVIKKNFN